MLHAVTCCHVSKIPLTRKKVSLHILLRVATCGLFHVKLVRNLQYHVNVCYCINKVDIPVHTLLNKLYFLMLKTSHAIIFITTRSG